MNAESKMKMAKIDAEITQIEIENSEKMAKSENMKYIEKKKIDFKAWCYWWLTVLVCVFVIPFIIYCAIVLIFESAKKGLNYISSAPPLSIK